MLNSFLKKFILQSLFYVLASFAIANAQEDRVTDNKGTIYELFIPSVSERYPSANQVINEIGFTTLNFQSQDFAPNTSDYTNLNTGIRVLNDGRYRVTYRATTETINNNRASGEFRLTLNGTAVNNTSSYTYSRNNLVDKNTVTVIKILDLSTNDLIGVEGRVYESNRGASDSLRVISEGTMLTVEKVN